MKQEDTLQSTLSELRRAALSGRFDAFPALSARLQAHVIHFASDPPEDTASVHAQANALMQLLEASGQGLKAARDRLTEIARIRQGGGTYGDNGQRQQLAPPSVESRRL